MGSKSKSKTEQASIYVISGKDGFLAGKECERLLDKLIEPDKRAMSLRIIDYGSEKAEASDVFDELRTLPFLADRRVVVIKDSDEFVSVNRELLEKYFQNPSSSGVLVLVLSTWKSNTRLAKMLGGVGEHIKIGEMKRWELVKYASEYARREHGKSMSKAVAELLVELAGDEPGRVSSEIDKVVLFIGEGKTIRDCDIAEVVGNNRFFDAFGVIDAMSTGDAGQAVEKMRRMLAADRSAEFTVVGAFAYHFRQMFSGRALLDKGVSRGEVLKRCRVFYDRDGFLRRVNSMKLDKIGRMLGELAEIDHGVKSGRIRTATAMEQLVVEVCMS